MGGVSDWATTASRWRSPHSDLISSLQWGKRNQSSCFKCSRKCRQPRFQLPVLLILSHSEQISLSEHLNCSLIMEKPPPHTVFLCWVQFHASSTAFLAAAQRTAGRRGRSRQGTRVFFRGFWSHSGRQGGQSWTVTEGERGFYVFRPLAPRPSQVRPEGNILPLVGTSSAGWSGPFTEVLWGGLVFAAKWMFLFQRCLRWWTFSISPPPLSIQFPLFLLLPTPFPTVGHQTRSLSSGLLYNL